MKKLLFLLMAFSLYSSLALAQNVGIGTNNPKAKLDVNGRINLGNDTTVVSAGDIRYNERAGDFEAYDGEQWYTLTGKRNAFYAADTTGANSCNMTTDLANPIYVSDSSAFIYDDGGPLGNCSLSTMDIYIVNNAPRKAVGIKFYIENKDNDILSIEIDEVFHQVAANETIIISLKYPSDSLRIFTGNALSCSDFKISYQFQYSDTQDNSLPQGTFPLSYIEENTAMLGGQFSDTITIDSIGRYSFAYGRNSKAIGENSIAFGNSNQAQGNSSLAMGYNTLASGYSSSSFGYATEASGSYATAFGRYCKAPEEASTAMGAFTRASGENSSAFGYYSLASGYTSTAFGFESEATADYSTTMGFRTIASGEASSAFGVLTQAFGHSATAMGQNTIAFGISSLATGQNTQAIGISSTAMGFFAEAVADYSFAFGFFSKATGETSTAFGSSTQATGNTSTSFGFESQANGAFSTAFGSGSRANGSYSTTMGLNTVANGYVSTALGDGTEALASRSLAVGSYNQAQDNSRFEVGYGGGELLRRNAFTIKDNGFIGTKDVLQPLSNLHLKYSNNGWDSHMRLEYDGDAYGVFVYDFDGFKLRTFGVGDHIYFRNNANQTNALFNQNGNLTIRGSLTQNSDLRLKKDITPLSASLSHLLNLNGYQYLWKDNDRDPGKQTGLIAQEVQTILPDLVKMDEEGYLTVNYIGLIPHLIEATKALNTENDILKADLLILKERMDALEKQ